MDNQKRNTLQLIMQVLSFIIIGLGTLLRLAVYLQNRNLIIDEANVARNIYERGFAGLVLPLHYEQYAPPVFLWITKLHSGIFGFSEYALRLYPLLTGVAALFVFYALLKQFVSRKSMWYALFLFATVHIFVRYSSELKQYMPDAFIALSLVWLALKNDIEKLSVKRFTFIWITTGSIAIWSSMPSVFVLTGVGVFYMLKVMGQKAWGRLKSLILIGLTWVVQFLFYYLTILRPQANSPYLQNFHRDNFLYATPANAWEWQQNWAVVSALARQLGGLPYAILFNTILFFVAVLMFLTRDRARGMLLLIPVGTLFIAAAFNQFSLIPRVALFIIPILLLIIVYGLEQLYKIRNRFWQFAVTFVAVIYAISGSSIDMFWKPFKAEQLTEGLDYLKSKDIKGNDLSVYHSSGPALIYYTQINPRKENWKRYRDADIMKWNTAYDSLAWMMKYSWHITRPVGFVFTNNTEEELRQRINGLNRHLKAVDSFCKPYVKTYVYENQP
jgi:hypothetical protein